jgi:hypothetical protein
MLNQSLAVVCCYYNPCGYNKKYNNFLKFYASLFTQVSRIQVVELVYGNSKSSLPKEVKPLVVQANGTLWHKENLLNLGIDILLAEGYEYIAWLDADVLFANSSWAFDASMMLNSHNLCQLFSSSESFSDDKKPLYKSGCVKYWIESGNVLPVNESYSMGYGWAARSEVLYECGLYENAIMGGGDSLTWLASFSKLHSIHKIMEHHPITKLNCVNYYQNFISWADRWGDLVLGNVSYIAQPVISLSHGSLNNRRYAERYKALEELNFSPSLDLYHNDYGVLQSNNKDLYKKVFAYLKSRNEDGLSWFAKLIN